MSEIEKEWQRLYKDFEAQAGQYHELTLSVYFIIKDHPVEKESFEKPNHAVMLWQYFGNFDDFSSVEELITIEPTKYGHPSAIVTAFALIAGAQTALFRRMAYRAGSLLPNNVRIELGRLIMMNVVDPDLQGKPIFGCNGDPLSVWLNLVLFSIVAFQPERFQRRTLDIDPFAASLATLDYMLSSKMADRSVGDIVNMVEFANRRFKVALSFPGEKREYVSKIAKGLTDRLGHGSVFYDKYYEADLARPNLDIVLQQIYHHGSELIVVFFCKEYEEKEWCGLEWRAIRDIIKKRQDEKIMLMRFDNCEVSGSFSTDGYVDLHGRPPEEAVELICQRLKTLNGTNSSGPEE